MIYIAAEMRARNSELEKNVYFKSRRFCMRYSFYLNDNNV